jgi:hypothetical protein
MYSSLADLQSDQVPKKLGSNMLAASPYASDAFAILSALSMAAHFLRFASGWSSLPPLILQSIHRYSFCLPIPTLNVNLLLSPPVSHVCCTFFFSHTKLMCLLNDIFKKVTNTITLLHHGYQVILQAMDLR